MNLILLSQSDFIDKTGLVRLEGRRLNHVLEVHRASVGDELTVGLLNGKIGSGRITRIDSAALEMDVHLHQDPPKPLPATLILALPRPKVLRRVIRSASMMGVKKIILINSYRVEKSYWQSPFLERASLTHQLMLGLEQARDTLLPEVLVRPFFKPFVEDEIASVVEGTTPILAHPGAIESCTHHIETPATIAIGPEGGFIPYEVERLISCGFKAIRLGERVLSVETAVPALLSRLV